MATATMESLQKMTTLPATQEPAPVVTVGFDTQAGFELIQRVAKMFSTSNLVPQRYQGNLPNCSIALNMAARLGADPLMVMQNLYVVHGTPAWSAQFLIACFNKTPGFSKLRYEFKGEEGTDEWACRAYAVEMETGETLHGSWVSIELAKAEGWYGKSGSKWQTMPQQMLMYRAASWFVRAYAPEIAMGLQTKEEAEDVYSMEQDESGAYVVTSAQIQEDAEVRTGRQQDEGTKGPALPKKGKDKPEPPAFTLLHCPKNDIQVRAEIECANCKDREGCPEHQE